MSAQRFFWSNKVLGAIATALVVGSLVHSPVSAQAASDTDGRWLPWYGCWQPTGAADDSTFLCLLPVSGDGGIEMTTRSKGETLSSEIVSADGLDRPVNREGCEGRERVQFSDDAARVYFHSDLVCEGGVRRVSEGMMSMLSPFEWMDVQTVDVDGESVPWVVRYQLSTSEASGVEDPTVGRTMAVGAARAAASRPPTLDDVAEASSQMGPQTVQAWVLEVGEPFNLNAKGLAKLADASVSESVIDAVVAVTYPQEFAVGQERAAVDDSYGPRRYRSRYPYGRYYDAAYLDPFYSSYGLGYYSPFGFGYGNGFGGGFYGGGFVGGGFNRGGTVVVIDRNRGDSGGTVVRGRGYTQSRSGRSSSGTARRVRSSSSSRGSSARSSGSSGSSGSASSSRGSSGSSGKASTSRRAKRRGGN